MRRVCDTAFLFFLLLGACTNDPVVTGDSRGLFDTSKGMYGGNEFDARSVEGAITLAGQPPSKTAMSPAAPAAPATPVAPAPASAPMMVAAADTATFAIDANAFAAVFGPGMQAVKPTPEQLLRLDSLALVAGDATRVDLQQKILACRRSGENCRIARR